MKRKKIGEILVQENFLTPEQLDQALVEAKKKKNRLGATLILMDLITEDDIFQVLSRQLGIPQAGLASKKINPKILDLIPADFCYKNHVVPLGFKDKSLWVAMADPTDYETLKDMAFITECRTKPAIEKSKIILDFLMRYHSPPLETQEYDLSGEDTTADEIQVMDTIDDQDDISFTNLERAAKGGVVRQLTNGIIANAIKEQASDIHIEPQEDEVVIRFRVDGIMRDVMSFTKTIHPSVVSRIKIMTNLDITQRRIPQDGRARIKVMERPFDLRISSLPTYYGEKIVIRILEARLTLPLENLGMGKPELDRFKALLKQPKGLVLITGPTGSGKTTTLYSALGYIFSPEINIVTIEDPIEYSLPGINQVHVNTAAGMTFAKGLRSLLRQDPDVVMIGEIRDEETAAIALQAAQTGHLVLSTLHTNNAISAVTRLVNMGIEPFWITSSLLCVIAQKLVRKIHTTCSRKDRVPEKILSGFPRKNPDIFKRGQGCSGCRGSGYSGRIGIYEMLVIDKNIKKMIMAKAQDFDILYAARMSGMKSITEDGFQKAVAGLTTLDEVIRVAPPGENKEGKKPSSLPQRPGKVSEPVSDLILPLDKSQRLSLKDCIMVIDDDEAILRIVKKILTNEFYEVVEVSNGKDGLNQVFEHPPDLILVDYEMPGINGIDFIKKLKANSRVSKIPVIMLTATQAEETEIDAFTMGADDWISKPIQKARLLARIKRLLKK
ncbi:MAG: Flp pilus assembly complex ATPase component TadA [Desulfobacula sp.]|jgi:type IV pilus assembly protein PilB|nr:Flp pilus assembly complex ATPase component TadA [Desulfobacula sp.]MBT7260970.1 Flp pilus assembly complex ATPase component TadA [Desulfobacula sp.]